MASGGGKRRHATWVRHCKSCWGWTDRTRRFLGRPLGYQAAPVRILRCSSSLRCYADSWVQSWRRIPTRTIRSRSGAASRDDHIRQSCTSCLRSRCNARFHGRSSAWWTRSPAGSPVTRRPYSGDDRCSGRPTSRPLSSWSVRVPTRRSTNGLRPGHRGMWHGGHLGQTQGESEGEIFNLSTFGRS